MLTSGAHAEAAGPSVRQKWKNHAVALVVLAVCAVVVVLGHGEFMEKKMAMKLNPEGSDTINSDDVSKVLKKKGKVIGRLPSNLLMRGDGREKKFTLLNIAELFADLDVRGDGTLFGPFGIKRYHSILYLQCRGEGQGATVSTQSYLGVWEKWYFEVYSTHYAIKNIRWGNYLSMPDGGGITTQTYIGSREQFSVMEVKCCADPTISTSPTAVPGPVYVIFGVRTKEFLDVDSLGKVSSSSDGANEDQFFTIEKTT